MLFLRLVQSLLCFPICLVGKCESASYFLSLIQFCLKLVLKSECLLTFDVLPSPPFASSSGACDESKSNNDIVKVYTHIYVVKFINTDIYQG